MNTTSSAQRTGFHFVALVALLVTGAIAGCGTKSHSDAKRTSSNSTSTPMAEAVLTRWEQGDTAGAVRQFLETDWSTKRLFTPGSAMNLSELQFKALSAVERESRSAETQSRLSALRKLAGAVAQAGREAAEKQHLALARKHFAALEQCGSALDTPDSMLIVQLGGRALKKMAAAEAAKLPR